MIYLGRIRDRLDARGVRGLRGPCSPRRNRAVQDRLGACGAYGALLARGGDVNGPGPEQASIAWGPS